MKILRISDLTQEKSYIVSVPDNMWVAVKQIKKSAGAGALLEYLSTRYELKEDKGEQSDEEVVVV